MASIIPKKFLEENSNKILKMITMAIENPDVNKPVFMLILNDEMFLRIFLVLTDLINQYEMTFLTTKVVLK